MTGFLWISFYISCESPDRSADHQPVGFLQSGAGEDTALLPGQQPGERLQPGQSVLVSQGKPGTHLPLVLLAVKIIAIIEFAG